MNVTEAKDILDKIRTNVEKVIVGKAEAINLVLICLICNGHALIEDVPGLGKTTLVSAIAESVDCSFTRLQFTPDVLPSDVTGFTMFDLKTNERQFIPGAVMTQILLADEINRTNPKTQSALLQAMQEGQVSVDGITYDLPRPFAVMATQNPVELTGTYSLPEAQLDRFLMRISIGYPEKNDERQILERNREKISVANLEAVTNAETVTKMQDLLDKTICTDLISDYIIDISRKTREHKEVLLGVSPRGSISLMRAAMGEALLNGRGYVLPDDVHKMLEPVLAHRIILRSKAYAQKNTVPTILQEIKQQIAVPAVK
ncbi:MAG: MoxR family ATPase [Oscillospiraceae bacterium]|nr:MoxR family ATPase [Oscillospiraceae bacterium]MCL2277819.1 MoxR family ATPase [Oscillospiraceae bacterium]